MIYLLRGGKSIIIVQQDGAWVLKTLDFWDVTHLSVQLNIFMYYITKIHDLVGPRKTSCIEIHAPLFPTMHCGYSEQTRSNIMYTEAGGSYCLLGYDTVYSGRQWSAFRWNLYSEDWDIMFFRNVGIYPGTLDTVGRNRHTCRRLSPHTLQPLQQNSSQSVALVESCTMVLEAIPHMAKRLANMNTRPGGLAPSSRAQQQADNWKASRIRPRYTATVSREPLTTTRQACIAELEVWR